jgi:hypothetical protein
MTELPGLASPLQRRRKRLARPKTGHSDWSQPNPTISHSPACRETQGAVGCRTRFFVSLSVLAETAFATANRLDRSWIGESPLHFFP